MPKSRKVRAVLRRSPVLIVAVHRIDAMNSLQRSVAEIVLAVIAPALVMAVVGSVTLFLSAVFYHGEYPVRLAVILSLFTFASVLISRIAISESPGYAMGYGLALGGVMLLAMTRFVQLSGPMAAFSMPINVLLIGTAWFFAHKLTWDGTFVDLSRDVTAKGLLDNVGGRWKRLASLANPPVPEPSAAPSANPAPSAPPPTFDPFAWLRKRRANTPGLWVIYFALLALPLFGLGQGFIPASDQTMRRFAFLLFVVYLIGSLGLLMTTSLIGLMRYLNKRAIELPNSIMLSWLGLGSAAGAAIVLAAWLLPRPAAEWSIIPDIPLSFVTPESTKPNSWSVGNDGKQEGSGRASGPSPDRGTSSSASGQGRSPGGSQSGGSQS
ncbi:MAG TPA: hypothetical protein DCQ98_13150, partial [Planctomycetaceae bacterium]|nr:hypothetical protein [Planctomycetaceae bacterium]